MANYAYLRVSTHTQDVENQKLSVLDYCNSQGIAPIEFVEDTTSGRRSWRDREIGRLLETADAGDVLVAAEVSRLARSTLQVLELLQAAAERGVTVHIAKNRMVLDQSLPATITATILGLAAQIEREFISARTKEALKRRKAAGLPVGRPTGFASSYRSEPSTPGRTLGTLEPAEASPTTTSRATSSPGFTPSSSPGRSATRSTFSMACSSTKRASKSRRS